MNSTPSSGKVEGLIEEASGRITGDSGREATGRARQGLADASRTATETLRDASRDLVEAFVSTVAKEAANDRAALVCKLNSYCQPEEVRP